MPSAEHEMAHQNLGMLFFSKIMAMGLSTNDLCGLGATRCDGRNSSKEGDLSYKPILRKNKTDWPTIVFESGLSESLRRLRDDARWWLTNSKGDVEIVVIILINPTQSSFYIERWELAPLDERRPTTGAFLNELLNRPGIPSKLQEITIDQHNVVTGAPLVLEFQKIFLRPAAPPETDIEFSAQELSIWAANIWNCLQ